MYDNERSKPPKPLVSNVKTIGLAAILLLSAPHLLAGPAASAPGDDCAIIVERPYIPHKGLEPRVGSAYDSACQATDIDHQHVYAQPNGQQKAIEGIGFEYQTVETFELPPGTYAMHVELAFTLRDQRTSDGILHARATCDLRGAPGGVASRVQAHNGAGMVAADGGYEGGTLPSGMSPGHQPASLFAVVIVEEDTPARLRCAHGGHIDYPQYVRIEGAIAQPIDEYHQM